MNGQRPVARFTAPFIQQRFSIHVAPLAWNQVLVWQIYDNLAQAQG
jgi:hypothetical protein